LSASSNAATTPLLAYEHAPGEDLLKKGDFLKLKTVQCLGCGHKRFPPNWAKLK